MAKSCEISSMWSMAFVRAKGHFLAVGVSEEHVLAVGAISTFRGLHEEFRSLRKCHRVHAGSSFDGQVLSDTSSRVRSTGKGHKKTL